MFHVDILYIYYHKYSDYRLWLVLSHREPQTPLCPPTYVNLVNAKDHKKIGDSEHNTDVTVGITNSYTPNICIYPPMF